VFTPTGRAYTTMAVGRPMPMARLQNAGRESSKVSGAAFSKAPSLFPLWSVSKVKARTFGVQAIKTCRTESPPRNGETCRHSTGVLSWKMAPPLLSSGRAKHSTPNKRTLRMVPRTAQ
jgi:hypothetical protein